MASVGPFTQVDYPDSDGKPMGETDEHRDAMSVTSRSSRSTTGTSKFTFPGTCWSITRRETRTNTSCSMRSWSRASPPIAAGRTRSGLRARDRTWCLRRPRARRGARTRRRSPSFMAAGREGVLLIRPGSGISGPPSPGLSPSRSQLCAAETRPRRRSDESGTGTAAAVGRGGSAILSLGYRRTAPDPGRSPTGR